MQKYNTYTILEVNSSNLKLMVIEKNDDFTHFIYKKQTPYNGFENMRFNDAEELFILIQQAFKSCESSTGIVLNEFYVILPQRFCRTSIQEKSKLLNGKAVEERDICKSLRKYFVADSGFKAVNMMPIYYKIDNVEYMQPPLGIKGKSFSVVIEQLSLEASVEELFSTCAKRLGKSINYWAVTSLALQKFNKNINMPKSIFVAMNEKTTDISCCENNNILETVTVEWGGDYVFMALMDFLNIDEDTARKLTAKLNFNLPIEDSGNYVLADGSKNVFSISEVNKNALTTLYFIIKELNKKIALLNRGIKLPIYFFGNDLCNIKGIKDILENFTEADVVVLKTKTKNEEKINYTLDALLNNIDNNAIKKVRSFKDLLKIKFN